SPQPMDQTPPELRVMVDANILIAGSVWPRWPYEVLQHALRGDFRLVLCEYVIQQARRRIQARFPVYVEPFDGLLEACRYEWVADPSREQVAQHHDLVRDLTDVPVALAAINARVDYLVSEDKDLTVRDETTAKLHQSLSVMVSGAFLREVMGWSSEALEEVRRRTWRDIQSPDEP
ncbi:MAG: PIN domain-containing protein, partial [Anaerolineales bacterium]|nr:PIN domain-containing protein [Anaerolineales bacterium]